MRIRSRQNKAFKRSRSRKGWALVAIITVSMFATMFLFSLAGLSASLLQTEGAMRQRTYALAGAETGLDYARRELNKSLITGERSDIEPVPGQNVSDPYGLPVQYLPQLGNRCRVMLRVTRVSPTMLENLALMQSPAIPYSANQFNRMDVSQWKFGSDWRSFAIADSEQSESGGYTWLVEVSSYCGLFATSIRGILVGAFPDTYQGAVTDPKDMFFSQGIVADRAIVLGSGSDSLTITSSGEEVGGVSPKSFSTVIQTNGSLTANAKTSIFADLRITNPDGATSSVANGTKGDTVTEADSSIIYGRVETNAIGDDNAATSGFDGNFGDKPAGISPTYPLGTDNVKALADGYPDFLSFANDPTAMRQGINRESPIFAKPVGTANQQVPNPVPSPTDALPLPDFPSPNPFDPDAAVPNPIVDSSKSFQTFAFDSTNSDGALEFTSTDAANPTKIFIEDSVAASNSFAVNIKSSQLKSPLENPNIQLYYAGSKDILITMDGTIDDIPDLKMLIYAPNASIKTIGKGDFNGAIVGKDVTLAHKGTMKLDPAASQVLADRRNAGVNGPDPGNTEPSRRPTYYKLMSWQQISGALVPLD